MFSGLPGVGKTTLAQAVAADRGAAYLRIDVIEQALRSAAPGRDIGPEGYVIGCALARSNLAVGREVVADAVNAVAAARAAWREAGAACGSRVVEIEVVCSDLAEHRRRIETRQIDIAGLRPPTWDEVASRRYEPWTTPRITIDTARRSVGDSVAGLMSRLDAL